MTKNTNTHEANSETHGTGIRAEQKLHTRILFVLNMVDLKLWRREVKKMKNMYAMCT